MTTCSQARYRANAIQAGLQKLNVNGQTGSKLRLVSDPGLQTRRDPESDVLVGVDEPEALHHVCKNHLRGDQSAFGTQDDQRSEPSSATDLP